MSDISPQPYFKSLKIGSLNTEKGNLGRMFTLTNWQYIVILGIALSGVTAFVNTYNTWSQINAKLEACENSKDMKKQLHIQFMIILVLSILALILGILLAWYFRTKTNQRQILTIGIMTTGIFGILYAISMKLRNLSNGIQLGISWIAFVGFLFLGYYISSVSNNSSSIRVL